MPWRRYQYYSSSPTHLLTVDLPPPLLPCSPPPLLPCSPAPVLPSHQSKRSLIFLQAELNNQASVTTRSNERWLRVLKMFLQTQLRYSSLLFSSRLFSSLFSYLVSSSPLCHLVLLPLSHDLLGSHQTRVFDHPRSRQYPYLLFFYALFLFLSFLFFYILL